MLGPQVIQRLVGWWLAGWGETRPQGGAPPRPHRAGFAHWAELVQWAESPSEFAQKWKLGGAQHIAHACPATSTVAGQVTSIVMLHGGWGVGIRRGGGEQGVIRAVRVEPRHVVIIVAEDRRRVGSRAK